MPTVVLDPGHGGYDPGAVGQKGTREKDITLAVALKAGAYLQQAEVKVAYTRIGDQVPRPGDPSRDLAARCDIANKVRADLFVSIHCNSATNQSARGTETYSFRDTGEGRRAAALIHAELVQALKLPDRGLKTANFYVLRHTAAPAVLVELAFISNPDEEKLLADPAFQNRAAKAIAAGVAAYFGLKLKEQVPRKLKEQVPRLVIDGMTVNDVPFRVIDGVTWVPLRPYTERLGFKVAWDEETRTINVITGR